MVRSIEAPFGYDKDDQAILVRNPHEATGLILAFEQHATGQYRDADIATLLNGAGYRTKKGWLFSKDTVRDMLQNQTYPLVSDEILSITDPEEQHKLIQLIVDRVVAITLLADYHVVLGHNPKELTSFETGSSVYTFGSDGH